MNSKDELVAELRAKRAELDVAQYTHRQPI